MHPELTSRAAACPTNPSPAVSEEPSARNPRPLIWVWAAVLFSRELPLTSLIWTMIGSSGLEEPLVQREIEESMEKMGAMKSKKCKAAR